MNPVALFSRLGKWFSLSASLLAGGSALASSQPASFSHWPAGQSPTEIGQRVAQRFVESGHTKTKNIYNIIIYPEVCAWYGALSFADLTKNAALSARLQARWDKLISAEEKHLIPKPNHVDFTVFGAIPLEIFRQTGNRDALKLGLWFADEQWAVPTDDGLTNQTRFWIDDMYMISAVQVQAFRATGEKKYLDRAAFEMTAYLDKLQKPNGLFYHAPDVPFFWGRGNGWMAAGMTEILRDLPRDHVHFERIYRGYKTMMESLLQYQAESGMWRQLVDGPDSWEESSSTAMFAYAMVTGVKLGLLDEAAYGPAARKAWLALAARLDANGDIPDVCEGTNKLNSREYYLKRGRKVGDLHGQAPILWTASAFLR